MVRIILFRLLPVIVPNADTSIKFQKKLLMIIGAMIRFNEQRLQVRYVFIVGCEYLVILVQCNTNSSRIHFPKKFDLCWMGIDVFPVVFK